MIFNPFKIPQVFHKDLFRTATNPYTQKTISVPSKYRFKDAKYRCFKLGIMRKNRIRNLKRSIAYSKFRGRGYIKNKYPRPNEI